MRDGRVIDYGICDSAHPSPACPFASPLVMQHAMLQKSSGGNYQFSVASVKI